MIEIRLTRVQAKVLKALSETTQPVRATNLTEVTEETGMTVGKTLRELERMHLTDLIDKKNKLWQISGTGNEVLATLQAPAKIPAESAPTIVAPQEPTTVPPTVPTIIPTEVRATVRTEERHPEPTTVPPAPEAPPAQPEGASQGPIVPSQAAILKDIGERLGVSSTPKKGEGAALDAIIYFVERTADMNNLTQVWNSITKMGVPAHIINRWITLYAQTLTDKRIPQELQERMDTISEKDKVTAGEKGEIPPRSRRGSALLATTSLGTRRATSLSRKPCNCWLNRKGSPPTKSVH